MSRRGAAALVLSALFLAGCFTGERPYFDDDPFSAGSGTGYAEADAVLAKLDAVTTGPVTAAYSVLTKFGNTTSMALVEARDDRRSITIGNVRFIVTPDESVTCTVDGSAPCADGVQSARISDIGITIEFYAAEAATRLRRDARAAIAPPTASVQTIAAQQATCVDVPLSGGVAVYCVLDNGLIARLDDGDVAVNLTLVGPHVDSSHLQIPLD